MAQKRGTAARRVRPPTFSSAPCPGATNSSGTCPGYPAPLRGAAPAVLLISFTDHTVTVGPIAGGAPAKDTESEDCGPCIQCVHPALTRAAGRPGACIAPALFAFAAGACGLFVRAFSAPRSAATSMSLTFDIAAPHVEHRLWSCGRAA